MPFEATSIACSTRPPLARALVAARVESLGPRGSSTGPTRLIYARNAERLVVPASNMKLLTIAAAADALGWDYRYETRLEAAGSIANGTLTGDLVVIGSGDPSIGSPDGGHAPAVSRVGRGAAARRHPAHRRPHRR